MRVLYVSHTASSAAPSARCSTCWARCPATVQPLLAAPRGRLSELAEQRGIATTQIRGTAGSLRLHPLHTPRALAEMALAAWQVRRAAARHRADVVHANSIRAGIVLAFARLRATPTIVHVRDCLPPGRVSRATLRLIAATRDADRRELPLHGRVGAGGGAGRAHRRRAQPGRPRALRSAGDRPRGGARRRWARRGADGRLLLGVVAQLSPWKGQDTAIEALRAARAARGSTRTCC